MTIKHDRQDQRRALERMVRILEPAGRRILEIGTDQDCNVLRGLIEAGAARAVGINPKTRKASDFSDAFPVPLTEHVKSHNSGVKSFLATNRSKVNPFFS